MGAPRYRYAPHVPRVLLTLGGIAAFVALLWWAVWAEAAATCEACMVFEGRRACGSVSASSRDLAAVRAVSQACSKISGGVTGGLACERTRPERLQCQER